MHVVKALVDVFKRLVVRHEFVDPEGSIQVIWRREISSSVLSFPRRWDLKKKKRKSGD